MKKQKGVRGNCWWEALKRDLLFSLLEFYLFLFSPSVVQQVKFRLGGVDIVVELAISTEKVEMNGKSRVN